MGIADYITKPFSPEAITAVVQHTVGKYGPAGTVDDQTSLVTGEDLAATDEADRAGARSTALAQLRTALVDVLAAQVALADDTPDRRGEGRPRPPPGHKDCRHPPRHAHPSRPARSIIPRLV